jgi:hypothetical protein
MSCGTPYQYRQVTKVPWGVRMPLSPAVNARRCDPNHNKVLDRRWHRGAQGRRWAGRRGVAPRSTRASAPLAPVGARFDPRFLGRCSTWAPGGPEKHGRRAVLAQQDDFLSRRQEPRDGRHRWPELLTSARVSCGGRPKPRRRGSLSHRRRHAMQRQSGSTEASPRAA